MSFASPADVLPHAPEAVMVRSIVSRDATAIECVAVLESGAPLAHDGSWSPSHLGIEMCAQAAGLHAVLGDGGTRPAIGFLVEVRELVVPEAQLMHGVEHSVVATRIASGLGVAEYEVRLSRGATTVLAGRIKTFLPS